MRPATNPTMSRMLLAVRARQVIQSMVMQSMVMQTTPRTLQRTPRTPASTVVLQNTPRMLMLT